MNASGPPLRDIHLPEASWWPPALGWWLLGALILAAALGCVWFRWRGRRARSARRAAMREVDALAARHAQDRDDVALAAGLSRLLRRAALLTNPAAAAHAGAAWREFITRRAPVFDDEQLDALVDAPYRARASFGADALLAATRDWCRCSLRSRARVMRVSP